MRDRLLGRPKWRKRATVTAAAAIRPIKTLFAADPHGRLICRSSRHSGKAMQKLLKIRRLA